MTELTYRPEVFVRARLDEDQAWAEGCRGHHWRWVCSDNDQVAEPNPVEEEYLVEDGARLALCSVETKMSEPISRPNGLPPWPAQPLPVSWPIYHAETIESAAAGHIVRHDPARVLAEVAGKRMILDLIQPDLDTQVFAPDRDGFERWSKAYLIACALASKWADHEDYSHKWAQDWAREGTTPCATTRHLWSIEQDDHEDASDDGHWVVRKPTGYGSFRCSCGINEHGRNDKIAELAKEHLDSTGA